MTLLESAFSTKASLSYSDLHFLAGHLGVQVGGRVSRATIVEAISRHICNAKGLSDTDTDAFVKNACELDVKPTSRQRSSMDPISEEVLDYLDEDDKAEFKDWVRQAKAKDHKRKLDELRRAAKSDTPRKKRRKSMTSPQKAPNYLAKARRRGLAKAEAKAKPPSSAAVVVAAAAEPEVPMQVVPAPQEDQPLATAPVPEAPVPEAPAPAPPVPAAAPVVRLPASRPRVPRDAAPSFFKWSDKFHFTFVSRDHGHGYIVTCHVHDKQVPERSRTNIDRPCTREMALPLSDTSIDTVIRTLKVWCIRCGRCADRNKHMKEQHASPQRLPSSDQLDRELAALGH